MSGEQREQPAGEDRDKAARGRPARKQRQQRGSRRDDSGTTPRTVPRLMRIAVEGFNRSVEPRKVAGLIRSLGEPGISVKASRGVQGPVLITVAWELAWYQWEVTVTEQGEAVNEVANGKEISELPEAQRRWNAAAREDGTLRLQWHTPPPGLPQ